MNVMFLCLGLSSNWHEKRRRGKFFNKGRLLNRLAINYTFSLLYLHSSLPFWISISWNSVLQIFPIVTYLTISFSGEGAFNKLCLLHSWLYITYFFIFLITILPLWISISFSFTHFRKELHGFRTSLFGKFFWRVIGALSTKLSHGCNFALQ